MKKSLTIRTITFFAGWLAALVFFFPILWMGLTAFKREADAVATPPLILFEPTLNNFRTVFARSDYGLFVQNSIVIAVAATFLAIIIGAPAAYAMAFYPNKKTKDVLVWMLSTKMMPAVGVLMPIYLWFRDWQLLDTRLGLIIIYTLMNLPIVVWLIYTFFKEIPKDLIEAARMDGAKPLKQLIYVLLPLTAPGFASTILLSIIFIWNEAFWSINLTVTNATPLTAFISSYSSPQGLFWAKLSAASLLAVAPIMILGWLTQKQLVRGLTFGAVK
jgi:ABC-type sugar transport system, permease component